MAHGPYETNDCNILWWTQMKFLANSIKHKTLSVSNYIPSPSICILNRPVTSPSTDPPSLQAHIQVSVRVPLCSPLKTSPTPWRLLSSFLSFSLQTHLTPVSSPVQMSECASSSPSLVTVSRAWSSYSSPVDDATLQIPISCLVTVRMSWFLHNTSHSPDRAQQALQCSGCPANLVC